MCPKTHRWEAAELGFEPRSLGTLQRMHTLLQSASCGEAPKAEQRRASPPPPVSAKSPCPLPVLRTSGEERGGRWEGLVFVLTEPCKTHRAELGWADLHRPESLKSLISPC